MKLEIINPDHAKMLDLLPSMMGLTREQMLEAIIELSFMCSVGIKEGIGGKLGDIVNNNENGRQVVNIIHQCWKRG